TTREEVQALAAATKLPLVLGNTQGELDDPAFLISQRVKIALHGHAPFAAATQAVHEPLKALREGTPPKNLKGLAASDLTARVTRAARERRRAKSSSSCAKRASGFPCCRRSRAR